MTDPVEALIGDLVAWIGPGGRPYTEVMEALRTSCPRLPVWEEANARGFVRHMHHAARPAEVALTELGLLRLRQDTRLWSGPAAAPEMLR